MVENKASSGDDVGEKQDKEEALIDKTLKLLEKVFPSPRFNPEEYQE